MNRRIGLIVPSSNTTIETEIPAMLGRLGNESFTFHSSRAVLHSVDPGSLADMVAQSDRCANELADADVDAIVALVTSAYRGEASRAGWTTEADLLDGRRTGADDVQACIRRPGSVILLAEGVGDSNDAGLLACAHVAVEQGAGYFGMFSVRPDLQGGGVGRATLAEAERQVEILEFLCEVAGRTLMLDPTRRHTMGPGPIR